MNKAFCVFIFSLGAVAGVTAAWMLAKMKFERLTNENIESVRQAYSRRTERESGSSAETNNKKSTETENSDAQKPDLMTYYSNKVRQEGYLGDGKKVDSAELPYIIPSEAFGELDEYDQISLTYYADGVLADENDEAIDSGEELVGKMTLDRLSKHETDSVFVRNDRLKTDYEILFDRRAYSEL